MAIDIIWEGKCFVFLLSGWPSERQRKKKTLNNAVIKYGHVYIIMQDDHFITLKNSKYNSVRIIICSLVNQENQKALNKYVNAKF